MSYEYRFPEKNPFRANEVTDLKFKIESRPDWFKALFVDFESVRSRSYVSNFNFILGIEDKKLNTRPNSYEKLIFSGHMGCGKSVELSKYATSIDLPEAYFVVQIDLEKESNLEQLEPEDILVVLISVLISRLKARGIRFEEDDFASITEELLSEKEDLEEVVKEYGFQSEAKAKIGWKFWQFLAVEANLKGAYGRNNKTTAIVRRAVKSNAKPILLKLNTALKGLRSAIQHQQQGQDILIVIDGLEKAHRHVYDSLFVKDVQLIVGIDAQVISTVPIKTYYEIDSMSSPDIFKTAYLPMLRLNRESKKLLKEMILRRVDASLFGKGVISRLIDMSGGCPRILLKLVNRCIVETEGEKIQPAAMERVLRSEGLDRWKRLTQIHRDALKSGAFDAADPEVLELLQSLSLLEYNGDTYDRIINPLIAPFVAAMP